MVGMGCTNGKQNVATEETRPFEEPLDAVREEEQELLTLSRMTYFDVPTLRRLEARFSSIGASKVCVYFVVLWCCFRFVPSFLHGVF